VQPCFQETTAFLLAPINASPFERPSTKNDCFCCLSCGQGRKDLKNLMYSSSCSTYESVNCLSFDNCLQVVNDLFCSFFVSAGMDAECYLLFEDFVEFYNFFLADNGHGPKRREAF